MQLQKVLKMMQRLIKGIQKILMDIFYDDKNYDGFGDSWSLGRTSFILWFYTTIIGVITFFNSLFIEGFSESLSKIPSTVITTFIIVWFLLGLSLLAYIIGRQNIITSITAGLSSSSIDIKNVDEEREAH